MTQAVSMRCISCMATLLLLSGCGGGVPLAAEAAYTTNGSGSNDWPKSNGKTCPPHYEGQVVASWDPNGRTMTLTQPFAFIDSSCGRWAVPTGATVDGASIPGFLWSIVGGPLEGRYRNASVVHDWYCAVRIEPSRDVHRMFYDGMIVSGVPKAKALSFYWAVLKFGPSWDDLTIRNNRLAEGKPQRETSAFRPAVDLSVHMDPQAAQITRTEVLEVEELARARNLGPADIERMAARSATTPR